MTIFNALQYASQIAIPPVYDDAVNSYGKFRIQRFNYTFLALGTIGDSVRIVRLPAGKVNVIGPLCRIRNSAGGASQTANIGTEAYRDKLGNVVAAALTVFGSALAWTAAASNEFIPTFPADGITTIESMGGVTITVTTAAVAPPSGQQINGFVVYTVE